MGTFAIVLFIQMGCTFYSSNYQKRLEPQRGVIGALIASLRDLAFSTKETSLLPNTTAIYKSANSIAASCNTAQESAGGERNDAMKYKKLKNKKGAKKFSLRLCAFVAKNYASAKCLWKYGIVSMPL